MPSGENLTAQLEHTYLVDEKGNKRKLPKKKRNEGAAGSKRLYL